MQTISFANEYEAKTKSDENNNDIFILKKWYKEAAVVVGILEHHKI